MAGRAACHSSFELLPAAFQRHVDDIVPRMPPVGALMRPIPAMAISGQYLPIRVPAAAIVFPVVSAEINIIEMCVIRHLIDLLLTINLLTINRLIIILWDRRTQT
jgi:hypothetical protein